MRETGLQRLDAWRQNWRRSFGYLGAIRRTRARGLWPARAERPARWSGVRVLLARGDRFGDMMLTLPFVARILASGPDLRVLATDRLSRQLLERRGIRCHESLEALAASEPAEAGGWRPDWVFFAEPGRRLRSGRFPERWAFVEQMLTGFRGAHFAMPVMRRGEAMSLFTGSFCTPTSGFSALRLLDVFADGLGLARAERPLLDDWIASRDERRSAAVVVNLSAGKAGESDRRDLPAHFWSEVAEGLGDAVRIACIVQPGDDRVREQAEADPRLGKEIVCFDDVADAAIWLGRQRLLLSPETGLCHLARNLALPMVVLTPKRKVPYFYPIEPDTGFAFAKQLGDIAPGEVIAAAKALLATRA